MTQLQEVRGRATSIVSQIQDGVNWTAVRYHSTDVVRWSDKGKIILNHGGYMTYTTKARMNQASNQFKLGFDVFQKDFEWFVGIDGHIIDFDRNPLVIRNGHD